MEYTRYKIGMKRLLGNSDFLAGFEFDYDFFYQEFRPNTMDVLIPAAINGVKIDGEKLREEEKESVGLSVEHVLDISSNIFYIRQQSG